jgi:hypothetical protein
LTTISCCLFPSIFTAHSLPGLVKIKTREEREKKNSNKRQKDIRKTGSAKSVRKTQYFI